MSELYFEDEAELFAYKAWETLHLEPPVDLNVVTSRLGIEVVEREFVEEIDGLYLRIPGAPPIIAINKSYLKPYARKRFTLAHEIGHHLLGHRVASSNKLFFFDAAGTKRTMVERSCDKFAALLLMPKQYVDKYYSELANNSEQRINIMADRFGVSSWALKRRLSELGMQVRWRRRV